MESVACIIVLPAVCICFKCLTCVLYVKANSFCTIYITGQQGRGQHDMYNKAVVAAINHITHCTGAYTGSSL